MVTITVVNYSYPCPYCGKIKKSKHIIPSCKVCGEFVCKQCREKDVCPGCLSKLNPDQKKLFSKKGHKKKILTQIFQEVYGPTFILAKLRVDHKDDLMALARKIFDREEATKEFQIVRENRVQDTHNPNLWQ